MLGLPSFFGMTTGVKVPLEDAIVVACCEHVSSSRLFSCFCYHAFVDDATLVRCLNRLNGITVGQSSFDLAGWDLNSKGIFTSKP